ncbi:MAG TPA: ATP-dependent Clp protease proteolytic subunit [Acidobacteriota bacterium]|nr:ATP-dependent Clp protease proteolytic subunit [Acidobacteriota bacterium]
MNLVPIVIEKTAEGERSYDIYSRLLKDRMIFLSGEINNKSSDLITAQMIFLGQDNLDKDILFFINSPGGSVSGALAIYDAMRFVTPDVVTICTGMAASGGALLLAAGTPGKRASLPNARIMIHQPLGGAEGDAVNIEIQAREILKLKHRLNEILAECTGKTVEQVGKDTDRDYWLSSSEAKDYKLVDRVITSLSEI